jgi:hypothetical protein
MAIEMNGPSGLVRLGWRPKTLTPGMAITVTIHPLRDGTNGGQFMTATLPDGRQMDGGRPAALKNKARHLCPEADGSRLAVRMLPRPVFLQRRFRAVDDAREITEESTFRWQDVKDDNSRGCEDCRSHSSETAWSRRRVLGPGRHRT